VVRADVTDGVGRIDTREPLPREAARRFRERARRVVRSEKLGLVQEIDGGLPSGLTTAPPAALII